MKKQHNHNSNYFDNQNLGKFERFANRLTNNDPTLQRVRDRLFLPIAILFNFLRLKPNMISFIGVCFAFAAAFTMSTPIWASIFIFLNLFFDGIDGVVARRFGTETEDGDLVDLACDTVSLIVMAIGLFFAEFVSVEILIFYGACLIIHTYSSAMRSKRAINVYRSLGARFLVSALLMGFFFVLFSNYASEEDIAKMTNLLLAGVSFTFIVTMIFDTWNARKSH